MTNPMIRIHETSAGVVTLVLNRPDKANALTERMLAALNTQPDADPKTILGNVRSAVDGFVKDAEQFDDLTMLCLEYKGKEGKTDET